MIGQITWNDISEWLSGTVLEILDDPQISGIVGEFGMLASDSNHDYDTITLSIGSKWVEVAKVPVGEGIFWVGCDRFSGMGLVIQGELSDEVFGE